MTDEEFQIVRTELERLSVAINRTVRQIVEQKAAIDALWLILEQKRLVSSEELERARIEARKGLEAANERE